MLNTEKTPKRKPYKRTLLSHAIPEKTTAAERSGREENSRGGVLTQVVSWIAAFVIVACWVFMAAVYMVALFVYAVGSLVAIVLVSLVEEMLSWCSRR